ncbi:PLP-dependent aminotransferase family protein [Citromicrobium bathyomarinum]|uniref:aminotransferase-like domain-containing protein n=2 Tax=Citromicrobium bathyomarinum TaxID=72174 RepID=UPI003159A925
MAKQPIAHLFRLDRDSSSSLQAQLRARIVETIDSGVLPSGLKLPSSRKLAGELGIARNTVSLAYQDLIASGHLISRERSGVYVAHGGHTAKMPAVAGPKSRRVQSAIMRKAPDRVVPNEGLRYPADWRQLPYPFIEGLYDRTLFPIAEWREASRMALAVNEVESWSTDTGEADDELLVEQFRQKILTRRGIAAAADEILVTVGEQQALHLIFELLCGAQSTVGLEDPGEPDIRSLVHERGATVRYFPVGDTGVEIASGLEGIDLFYVSPSRQRPTGVTMPDSERAALLAEAHRNDTLIVEDDFECELGFLADAPPSLKSGDRDERVVYVASLSKVLSPGLRLGFLVGPADFIRAARRLRNLTTRKPSPITQRTAGIFLSLGHYDAMLRNHFGIYERRLIALRDALNHYRPLSIAIPPVTGGTSYWVRGPENLDAEKLRVAAQNSGVLIEPATPYFADGQGRSNMFRLGVTSLDESRIRPGIEALSREMLKLMNAPADAGSPQRLAEDSFPSLPGAQLQRLFSDQRLNYQTVYGEPCIIELFADGSMRGRAGYAQEDRDEGRWWIEGDHWCRQWNEWAYGETGRFLVAREGNRILWLDDDGRRIDEALIAPSRD